VVEDRPWDRVFKCEMVVSALFGAYMCLYRPSVSGTEPSNQSRGIVMYSAVLQQASSLPCHIAQRDGVMQGRPYKMSFRGCHGGLAVGMQPQFAQCCGTNRVWSVLDRLGVMAVKSGETLRVVSI